MNTSAWIVALAAAALLYAANGWGEGEDRSIIGTKHNLSATGPGPIKSDDPDSEICIFCHTPHFARVDAPYLWNRADSEAAYITYESSTLHAGEMFEGRRRVGQPTGASKLCLSCHDGTIALGAVLSREQALSFPVGIEYLTEGRLTSGPGHLGTDLSDDHPVSFVYDEALAASHGELASPGSLPSEVRLDWEGMLQCTSCHFPHDNTYGKFLVMDNSHAALCTTCHAPTGWDGSSHQSSTATWNGQSDDPWAHTEYETVAENACANCHRPHKAGGRERLLHYANETANCVVCHNANVAQKNIVYELGKEFGHFVQNPDYVGVHDPAVDFSGPESRHVACVSCHNPHRTNADTATAPAVPGSMRGVRGIDAGGNPVASADYAYEVCFKCHSGANQFETGAYAIDRQDPQPDTRLAFDSANPSWHPVTAPQRFTDTSVPSLLPPYDLGGKSIYCTDCHSNDDASGPRGPHGSNHRYLLARNYTTADDTPESAYEYALCYQCHDRSKILADESGFPHALHLGKDLSHPVNAPCSACHDPHGSQNNTHLINFDLAIVSPPSELDPIEFVDGGQFFGTCYLTCHGKVHGAAEAYP
jgi:predicted CXXCH cytochrome family protein